MKKILIFFAFLGICVCSAASADEEYACAPVINCLTQQCNMLMRISPILTISGAVNGIHQLGYRFVQASIVQGIVMCTYAGPGGQYELIASTDRTIKYQPILEPGTPWGSYQWPNSYICVSLKSSDCAFSVQQPSS